MREAIEGSSWPVKCGLGVNEGPFVLPPDGRRYAHTCVTGDGPFPTGWRERIETVYGPVGGNF